MSAILLFAALAAAAPLHLQGTVRDAAGAAVANAAVTIDAGGDSARSSTDAEGRFRMDWSGPKLVMVTVEAAGFPRTRRALYLGGENRGEGASLSPRRAPAGSRRRAVA